MADPPRLPRTRPRSDADRGNMAVVIFLFFGTLIAGGLTILMLDQAWDPMISMANNSSNTSQSAEGISRAKTAWQYKELFVLILASLMGIAGAAATSRGR